MKHPRFPMRPSTYSVSRLKSYERCPHEYYHKYILRTPIERTYSESTLIGSLVHGALEYLYGTEDDQVETALQALHKSCPDTLLEVGVCTQDNYEVVSALLLKYAGDSLQLHVRASAGYMGSDPIRTRDGSVAVSPSRTSSWKQAEEDMDLLTTKETINDYLSTDIDVVAAFSEAYYLLHKYRTPAAIQEIKHVELPISHWDGSQLINPVKMPGQYGGDQNIYLNGYLDLVAITTEGLTIIDYKTDSEAYTATAVSCNRQLLAYVYAYEQWSGLTVEAIGINNIRAGELVLTAINRALMDSVLDSLFGTHKSIEAKYFPKKVPDGAYSPCLKCFGKVCPFLGECWPSIV